MSAQAQRKVSVTFTCPIEALMAIEDEAMDTRQSRSAVIAQAIEQWIKAKEKAA